MGQALLHVLGVLLQVDLQAPAAAEAHVAQRAEVGLLARVHALVAVEVRGLREPLVADVAGVRLLA